MQNRRGRLRGLELANKPGDSGRVYSGILHLDRDRHIATIRHRVTRLRAATATHVATRFHVRTAATFCHWHAAHQVTGKQGLHLHRHTGEQEENGD